ncbi:MAG: ATP-binding protein [Alphaproteobacteria bacterium]|nr:MAG: ATP-binding protein [Alphaproteobacteria bacterium]
MQKKNPVTRLGLAYSRYGNFPFGIRLRDRLMHLYIIGQTGTGKSTLLGNLARQDAAHGLGFCLVDPHGDLATGLHGTLDAPHLYWNVADPVSPFGYNPLTRVSAPLRPLIASGLIETLKKQWADAWGVRMEHLLRYAVLALLEQPSADIRDIIRLYVDKAFRRQVVARLVDEQVLQFWTQEFPNMNYQTAIDGVAPIANKLGAFLAHPVVRKAICAPEKPLRFRRLMDEGEILIVDLAKGRLGADTANVLGGPIVSSIMNAAFSRHDLPEAARRPFMLHVDEFHNFTTGVLAGMLAEARKYGLGVTLAHQHIVQAEREVFEAVLGNAGSLMAFRLGAADAPFIARQLLDIAERDLLTQPNHCAVVQLMVDGEKTRAFSAETLPGDIPPPGRPDSVA